MKCKYCSVELVDSNWYKSWQKSVYPVCISCAVGKDKKRRLSMPGYSSKYQQEYRKKNGDKVRSSERERYNKNRIHILLRKKKWNELHKDEINQNARNYRKTHKKESSESAKKYHDNHKEYYIELWRKYIKTPKGRDYIHRKNSRRRRCLGFNPLNQWFIGSHGHHINKIDIIYIPKEVNNCIVHNVKTGKNMEIINTIAYFFLLMQNIDKIGEILKCE